MAFSFTRFSWLWLRRKENKSCCSNGSLVNSISSLSDTGVRLRGETENLKFFSFKGVDRRMPSSTTNRKAKRKWKSREERISRMDKEHDVVFVPSDGDCLSGSESDDSDWSIGWLEPLAPDFQRDDEAENSFAILVPCYRHSCNEINEDLEPRLPFSDTVKNLHVDYSADGTKYAEQWLSYLQKF